MNAGKVLWITGLSGAGKSTLANSIADSIKEKNLGPVVVLDGDELRYVFGELAGKENTQYNRQARIALGLAYGRMSKMLAEQGLIVIVATISLFNEVHTWNRTNIKKYYEILITLPLETLIGRDPKNIYKDYFNGKSKNVAGFDLRVELPPNPDIHLQESDLEEGEELINKILRIVV